MFLEQNEHDFPVKKEPVNPDKFYQQNNVKVAKKTVTASMTITDLLGKIVDEGKSGLDKLKTSADAIWKQNLAEFKKSGTYDKVVAMQRKKWEKEYSEKEIQNLELFKNNTNKSMIYKVLTKIDSILDWIWQKIVDVYHAVLPKPVLNFVNNIKEKIKKFFMNIWNKIVTFLSGSKKTDYPFMFEADEPKNKIEEIEASTTKIKFLLNLILKCFLYAGGLLLIGNLVAKISGNGSIMNATYQRFNFLNDTPIIEQSSSTGDAIVAFILWPFKKIINGIQNLANSNNGMVKVFYYAIMVFGAVILTALVTFLYELYHKHSLSSNNKKPKTGWLI